MRPDGASRPDTEARQAPTVVAALVTRNRLELLRETLAAIGEQTHPVDRLIVVDNASTDGTREMLAQDFPQAEVVALPENQGATGGFYEAIAAGYRAGADWVWLMDDDSVARPTALEELVGALEDLDGASPALLCSRVEWQNGNPHVMNRPSIRRRDAESLVRSVRMGLLPVRAATWVSLLLSREAVERSGMPLRHFFYQADDIEYTARVLRDASGFYVPASVVEHRTPTQHTAVDDDHRFYFHIRNTVLMIRGDAWRAREKPVLFWWLFATSVIYLKINRLAPRALKTLLRGLVSGCRCSPR
jgi:GT2 family glycosyltransferase